ncbi:zinc-ribbon domain-containing protein [Clostridium tagluense]|uniref:Zinc-ribbon domain-containing protein n=1 Tax=Clostridium tagluense TaxID=360422 RepID=A0A401UUT1_9CLOT|nr:zinc-ribbon domain-containing protein [Clostridium tagluense]GCD13312.1 hypothetical protein Ctaglu_49350 [Clostridium tagluense]
MFCHNCSAQNDDGSNFCKTCGINLLIQHSKNEVRTISEKTG